MKAHFIQLLNYDHHTNTAILDAMIKAGMNTGEPAKLMAHTFGAQQIWLKRCMLDPIPRGPVWPDWTAGEMKAINEQYHQEWLAYLENVSDSEIEETIPYKNTKGDSFTNTRKDMIAHMINHGTHHRAQIGIYLKQAGATLPATDYIFYIRGLQ